MDNPFANYLDERKAEIISAVLKLADRYGTQGITTKRIASEVGFAEGAIYKHFKSKSDIFDMILDVSASQLKANFAEMDGKGLTPDRYLREWIHYSISSIEITPGIYRVIFSDELYVEKKKLFTKFKNITMGLAAKFEAVIAEGIRLGLFRPNIDASLMTILYLGVIHTSFTLWNIFEERRLPYRDFALPLFEEYLKSIMVQKKKLPRKSSPTPKENRA